MKNENEKEKILQFLESKKNCHTMSDNKYNEFLCYHQFNDFEKIQCNETQNDKLFIGCELEVSNRNYINDSFREEIIENFRAFNYNLFVGENDGSLDNGIEFISQPMNLKIWKSLSGLSGSFGYLMDEDFVSDESHCCGLHFHVNRDFFGDSEKQEKAINLLWLIFENFRKEFFKFSRRDKYSFERWGNCLSGIDNNMTYCYGTKTLETNKSMKYIERCSKSNRYLAINTTTKSTIEFRFIKGSLNYNTFMASLELIYNWCYLVKDILEKGDYKKLINKDFGYLINYNKHNELTSYYQSRNINIKNVFKDYTKLMEHLEKIEKAREKRIALKKYKETKRTYLIQYKCECSLEKISNLKDDIYRLERYINNIDFTSKDELIDIIEHIKQLPHNLSYNSYKISYEELKKDIKLFKELNKEKIKKVKSDKKIILDNIITLLINKEHYSQQTLRMLIVALDNIINFTMKGSF